VKAVDEKAELVSTSSVVHVTSTLEPTVVSVWALASFSTEKTGRLDCCTNAVVASCVVDVPLVAVGAVGVPVSAGDAKLALDAKLAIVA
jgi:hypothetical protein